MTNEKRIKALEDQAVLFGEAGMLDLSELCYQQAAKIAMDEWERANPEEAANLKAMLSPK